MAKQWWEMWFNDGDRYLIHGRQELRNTAKKFDFDSSEVIRNGECSLLDDDGDQVGGVQLIVNK